jgi:uncharacterized protein (DUF1330 family)
MIYAVVQLTITDPEKFAAYAAKAGPALKKWGAEPVAMSTQPTRLDGEGPAPGRAVLLSFPDKEAALGWIEDPEFAEVHALRRAAGDISTILIG